LVGWRSVKSFQYSLPDRIVTETAGVRRRNRCSLAVVELVELRADRSSGASKTRCLGHLGWRHFLLSLREYFYYGIVRGKSGHAFRRWKEKAAGVVERVAGSGGKPLVPHQAGEERGVRHRGRPSLITGAVLVRSHEIIVLDSDGNRLSVAESIS